MKRIKIIGLGLVLTFITVTMIYFANTPKNSSRTTKSTAHEPNVTKENFKDCPAANEFQKVAWGKPNEANKPNEADLKGWKIITETEAKELSRNRMLLIAKGSILKNLEKQSLINNACGITSLRFLNGFYSELGDNIRAKYYQQKMINFADSNNLEAIESLCSDLPFGEHKMAKYCEIIVSDGALHFSKKMKEYAVHFLASEYYLKKDVESLSKLCSKTSNGLCYEDLKNLSDSLFEQKKFELSKKYHNELINYYENFFVNGIGKPKNLFSKDDDFNKLYKLVDLYGKENMPKKLINLCTGSLHHKLIVEWMSLDNNACIMDLWKLGTQHFNEKKYNNALKLYQAIDQINSEPQNLFNYYKGLAALQVAEMYRQGKGIKKDDHIALEWYYSALENTRYKGTRADIYGIIGAILYLQHDQIGAFNNFKKSAELGNSWYQTNLALMYFLGEGVIQDYMEAYAWASVALAIGLTDQPHRNLAETVKKDAKKSLIYNAQPGATLKIANEFAKKHYDNSTSNTTARNS